MWSQTGDYFAITGKDTIEVWDTNQASVISSKKCEARPTALVWISDTDIIVGMDDGKIMFFNWEDEKEEAKIIEIYESRVKAMVFKNGFLATCSSAGELNLWKISSGDKVEMEMIAGIEVGCRLICMDLVEISTEESEQEIKDEVNEEQKTSVRQLKTSGCVTVEIDDKILEEKSASKRRKTSKPTKRPSVRLSNGFIEEDC